MGWPYLLAYSSVVRTELLPKHRRRCWKSKAIWKAQHTRDERMQLMVLAFEILAWYVHTCSHFASAHLVANVRGDQSTSMVERKA